ncbi:hypothetical protein [Microbacterium sp. YY-01]|uniref:hypothetical protein n=1 Tax=Microbacterium sp. YY-01 TaxID=3421634 RepID=UPI003D1710E0
MLKPFASAIVAALAAVVLVGCAPAATNTEPKDSDTDVAESAAEETTTQEESSSSAGASGEASLDYGDTEYSAELQFCSLSTDNDALFHGVAFDASGEVVGYLDGDFGDLGNAPYGEVRIDFGATEQFESTDEFVAMGDASAHIVVTDSSDTSLIIIGGIWDNTGAQLGTATLRVNCE